MNTSMFLPQMQEGDIVDKSGNQKDDINSLTEYVDEVLLGHTDNSPEDEDDDSGQSFHASNTPDSFFPPVSNSVTRKEVILTRVIKFPVYIISPIASLSYDVFSPPPES